MNTKKKPSSESIVREIKRKTRRKYSAEEKIRLLNLAEYEMDPEKSKLIYKQIEPIFKSDMPITVLFPDSYTCIANRRICGFEDQVRPDPIWFLENLWIEEEGK